jgi:hypothetical protein
MWGAALMDLLGTWGKRTQDLLGRARTTLLGEDLLPDEKRAATVGTMGPGIATQMQGLDTAQRSALAGGGVRGLMRDPGVATQATDLSSQLDLLGPIKAYHGTPHTFLPEPEHPMGRFRMDKLGTGEGAQAYGHGLYFAESPGVAESYQKNLAHTSAVRDKTWQAPPGMPSDVADDAKQHLSSFFGYSDPDFILKQTRESAKGAAQTRNYLQQLESRMDAMPGEMQSKYPKIADNLRQEIETYRRVLEQEERAARVLPHLEKHGVGGFTSPGSLYEVELGLEHEDLLDWDLPLSKQPPKVREAVEKVFEKRAIAPAPDWTGARVNQELARHYSQLFGKPERRASAEAPRDAATALRRAGIPGIRFLDAGSRGGGEGSRNVVLFDQELARIQGRR